MLMRPKKVKKAKTRKETERVRERERERESFQRLKSAKTRLAQLRSAENQFHILTLAASPLPPSLAVLPHSPLPLSPSLLNSLLGFSLHLGHAPPSRTNQGLLGGTQIFLQLSHFSASIGGQCGGDLLCIGPPTGDVTAAEEEPPTEKGDEKVRESIILISRSLTSAWNCFARWALSHSTHSSSQFSSLCLSLTLSPFLFLPFFLLFFTFFLSLYLASLSLTIKLICLFFRSLLPSFIFLSSSSISLLLCSICVT